MEGWKVSDLKKFVNQFESRPSLILHDPSLAFFNDYVQSLGGRIPQETKQVGESDAEDEIVESDIELEGEIVEADNDPPLEMGETNTEVSEERSDHAQALKVEAMHALSEGNLDEAIQHLTVAIVFNPKSAILYATRADILLNQQKPNAAIRDANAALEINPDLAKGYKTRGMARAMLGQWEEAASDLHLASKLDYDEDISSVLKKVEPNVRKIEEHRRKYERLRKERDAKKAESERRRQQAEAEAKREREKKVQSSKIRVPDTKMDDAESLAFLQEGSVIPIQSSKELEAKLRASSNLSRLVILYFTATWCGPCRFMGPLFTNLAAKYPKVVFLKVDIDQLRSVAQSWNISSVPTFFFMKNGKEVDKFVGADKNSLERKIEQLVSRC